MKAITQRIDSSGRIVSAATTLPTGTAGTQRTLVLMRESVIAALLSDAVLSAAFIAAGLAQRATTARAEVERVQQWVQKNIRYVLDPLRVELLQSPEVTLQRRQGDCDDHSTLLCALLSALGYDCRLVAIGFQPGAFAHVYSEVLIDGQWTAAETIKPWPLGKEPANVKATMRMVIAVPADQRPQLGFLKSIKKVVKGAVKVVGTTVKGAVKDPLGTAFNVGRAAAGDPSGLVMQAVGSNAQAAAEKDARKLAELNAKAAEQAAVAHAYQQASTGAAPASVGDFIERHKVPLAIGGAGLFALVLVLVARK